MINIILENFLLITLLERVFRQHWFSHEKFKNSSVVDDSVWKLPFAKTKILLIIILSQVIYYNFKGIRAFQL